MLTVKELKRLFKVFCNVDVEYYIRVLDKDGNILFYLKPKDDYYKLRV
jgi:hypothetical protein